MLINISTEYDIGQMVIINNNKKEFTIMNIEVVVKNGCINIYYFLENETETIKVNEGDIFYARTTLD